jgi:hypothetical protein
MNTSSQGRFRRTGLGHLTVLFSLAALKGLGCSKRKKQKLIFHETFLHPTTKTKKRKIQTEKKSTKPKQKAKVFF